MPRALPKLAGAQSLKLLATRHCQAIVRLRYTSAIALSSRRSPYLLSSMHSGALRALEFDRIVEAVAASRRRRLARRGWRGSQPLIDAARGGARRSLRRRRRSASCATATIGLQAPEDLDATLTSLAVEGRALEPQQLVALARLPGLGRRHVRARCAARAARFPSSAAIADDGRLVRAGDRRHPPQDRPGRRGRGRCQPGAAEHPGSAAEAARAAARHARVLPARQGHGEVPPAADRHRPQRPLRARRARASTARRSRESSTAAPAAAPASFSSRSAPSRSTTTSSRSSSRKRKKSAGSCWRCPMRSAARGTDLQRTVDAATELDVLQARASFSLLVDGVAAGDRGRRPARAARRAASAADSGAAASPRRSARRSGLGRRRRCTARRAARAAIRSRSTSS